MLFAIAMPGLGPKAGPMPAMDHAAALFQTPSPAAT